MSWVKKQGRLQAAGQAVAPVEQTCNFDTCQLPSLFAHGGDNGKHMSGSVRRRAYRDGRDRQAAVLRRYPAPEPAAQGHRGEHKGAVTSGQRRVCKRSGWDRLGVPRASHPKLLQGTRSTNSELPHTAQLKSLRSLRQPLPARSPSIPTTTAVSQAGTQATRAAGRRPCAWHYRPSASPTHLKKSPQYCVEYCSTIWSDVAMKE